jgi:hypothetical protein
MTTNTPRTPRPYRMSFPAGRRRALEEIEKTLTSDHPGLGTMFAIFTRLAGHEAMPPTERVAARPWRLRWQRRMWPRLAPVVGLAMVTVALFTLGLAVPSSLVCPGTATSTAARVQSAPTGRQSACVSQQDEPRKISRGGLHGH